MLPDATVWPFGRRLNGGAYEASDLDLAVRFPPDAIDTLLTLARAREALMESELPIRVDLMELARIPAAFRAEIDRRWMLLQAPENP